MAASIWLIYRAAAGVDGYLVRRYDSLPEEGVMLRPEEEEAVAYGSLSEARAALEGMAGLACLYRRLEMTEAVFPLQLMEAWARKD
jgi:hypothetical protein